MSARVEVEWYLAHDVVPHVTVTHRARGYRLVMTAGEAEDLVGAIEAALREAQAAAAEEFARYRARKEVTP